MSHRFGATYFVSGESGRLILPDLRSRGRHSVCRFKVVKVLKVFKVPKDFFLWLPYSATLFTEARIFLYSIGVTLMNSHT